MIEIKFEIKHPTNRDTITKNVFFVTDTFIAKVVRDEDDIPTYPIIAKRGEKNIFPSDRWSDFDTLYDRALKDFTDLHPTGRVVAFETDEGFAVEDMMRDFYDGDTLGDMFGPPPTPEISLPDAEGIFYFVTPQAIYQFFGNISVGTILCVARKPNVVSKPFRELLDLKGSDLPEFEKIVESFLTNPEHKVFFLVESETGKFMKEFYKC